MIGLRVEAETGPFGGGKLPTPEATADGEPHPCHFSWRKSPVGSPPRNTRAGLISPNPAPFENAFGAPKVGVDEGVEPVSVAAAVLVAVSLPVLDVVGVEEVTVTVLVEVVELPQPTTTQPATTKPNATPTIAAALEPRMPTGA